MEHQESENGGPIVRDRVRRDWILSRTLLWGFGMSLGTIAIRSIRGYVMYSEHPELSHWLVFLAFDLPFSLLFGYIVAESRWRRRSSSRRVR